MPKFSIRNFPLRSTHKVNMHISGGTDGGEGCGGELFIWHIRPITYTVALIIEVVVVVVVAVVIGMVLF